MKKVYNLMGEFLMARPIGYLYPLELHLPENIYTRPLFKTVDELAAMMPGHQDVKNLRTILTNDSIPEEMHEPLTAALRGKFKLLRMSPEAISKIPAEIAAIIQALKTPSNTPAANRVNPSCPHPRKVIEFKPKNG